MGPVSTFRWVTEATSGHFKGDLGLTFDIFLCKQCVWYYVDIIFFS